MSKIAKGNLAERVRQFEMLELPGQPRMMHMGTSYLVSDLWREIERLEAALTAAKAAEGATGLEPLAVEEMAILLANANRRWWLAEHVDLTPEQFSNYQGALRDVSRAQARAVLAHLSPVKATEKR